MSCPYFVPLEKNDAGTWLHPSRLPLGAGFTGQCSAPGHDGIRPSDDELRELCNMGYAVGCARLPQERSCDAVRFSVARESAGVMLVWFVCETAHLPVLHGTLQYDANAREWISPHGDSQIQKLAECYVRTYLAKKIPVETELSLNS
ncbi:MAG TPA: hypothetical protein VH088_21295 [Terriglobales bacterium]|nr:hypothetical protein [Terriglobales bacterium]